MGLVDHERARVVAGQSLAVGGDDLVIEDRDLTARRDGARGRRPPPPSGAAANARLLAASPSFIDAGQTTIAG